MSREQVGQALEHLRDEKERIGARLVELDNHHGYRLLDGAELIGESARRQEELKSRLASLWMLFDHYGRTLQRAGELHESTSRPGGDLLAELTFMLTGPSVELPPEEVPLERRTLLAEPSGETLTLQAVVERMTRLYETAAQQVAVLDSVWSVLLDRLDTVESAHRDASGKAAELGSSTAGLDRVGAELEDLAETVRTDPLRLSRGDRPDTAPLDALAAELDEVAARLEDALRFRAAFEDRLRELRATVEGVRRAEDELESVRAEVMVKIADPSLPDTVRRASGLVDGLTALGGLAADGAWEELAERAADVRRAAREAERRIRTDLALATGLLDRREELRGRLLAYKVKAARLGRAEDLELVRLHNRIRELLWSAPCDLRQATVLLASYQQSVNAEGPGA